MSASRTYKYYDFCMAAFVCILLCANLIGPAKATTVNLPIIGPVTFLAGVLLKSMAMDVTDAWSGRDLPR